MPEVYTEEDIEIRSDEVQEILAHIPSWTIRWGTSVIFGSVIMLVVSSFFIKYPDTITSRITLTTEIPPTPVVARVPGKIQFFVADNEQVQEGQPLGVIDNSSDTEDVLALSEFLQPFGDSLLEGSVIYQSRDLPKSWQLGELQAPFNAWRAALTNYEVFQDLEIQQAQIRSLNQRIVSYRSLNQQLERQLTLFKQEVALALKEFKTDSTLYARRSIPEIELDAAKNRLLQTQRSYENTRSGIINNEISISQLQAQIGELELRYREDEMRLRNAISESYKSLESATSAWQQNYLLEAPIPGQVSFSTYWSDNQFVNAGEEVLTVIPDSVKLGRSNEIIAQMKTPVFNSGKLAEGQEVFIRFDNYPSEEWGIVEGRVASISSVPREEVYTVQVTLPEGLISSYGKTLEFRPEMMGTADVITEDLRLIERIFNQFRALIDNSQSK